MAGTDFGPFASGYQFPAEETYPNSFDYSAFGPYASGYGGNTAGGSYGDDWSGLTGEPLQTDVTPWQNFATFTPTGNQSGDSYLNYLSSIGANQPGSLLSSFLNPNNLADLGSMFGSLSSGEKANRLTGANLTQNYDQLKLAEQSGRNQNESDALSKLAVTKYLKEGGSKYKPGQQFSIGGKTYSVPDFGFGPTPASQAQMQGAADLEGQLTDRLKPGGSYTITKPDYLNPGTMENIGSYGGLASGGLGYLGSIMNPQAANGGYDLGKFLNTAGSVANAGKTILSLFGG